MNGPVEASFSFVANADTPGVVTMVATFCTRMDADDARKAIEMFRHGLLPGVPRGWNDVAARELATALGEPSPAPLATRWQPPEEKG